MHGPPDHREPVEKIRKAQWTVENTRATQRVVDELVAVRDACESLFGRSSRAVQAFEVAIVRLIQLDPKVHR